MSGWSETSIAAALQRTVFQRKCVLLVPNVSWMVHEADVLGVTAEGRLIDIEIKISRADLKADAKKDKWWQRQPSQWLGGERAQIEPVRRDWPPKIWRHYYCVPTEIWKPELAATLGSPKSGVVTIDEGKYDPEVGSYAPFLTSVRRAQSNTDAPKLDAADILDVARLANLRMWDALARRDRVAA